jgi:hypothetical protein
MERNGPWNDKSFDDSIKPKKQINKNQDWIPTHQLELSVSHRSFATGGGVSEKKKV